LSILLIRLGLAHFRRESLIGREIDTLNIRFIWTTFKRQLFGPTRNPLDWYKNSVATLYQQRYSIIVVIILGIIGAISAYYYALVNSPMLLDYVGQEGMKDILSQVSKSMNFEIPTLSFRYIFFNNLRAIFASLILGVFTLSIGGMMTYLVNIGLIGGVLGLADGFGFSPVTLFFAGVLPHGIFEITAIVISTAAILHMGVMLVTPDSNRTMSQVFIESIANWFRIMVGFGFPLLFIAALLETYVTPQIIVYFMK
jgi:stage II sporulation protein M